ncbi:hypothetical protein [Pacificoceanicola onchidii]|uniref:hypothetical protein n=1 Tax=Pacificoceanicola onchidii TaxID=2562685 RepID=UPI0010A30992|nr:hypothetical protein [Pacificoceanicola onchidii]
MKDAPFNITTVLLAVLGVGLVAGGLWGAILSAMGLTDFWGIFLAGWLPVPLASLIRQGVAGSAASFEGADGKSPMAFSLPVRLAIAAVIAAGIAYAFSLSEFYSLGFLMGAVASLIVQTCLIVIFYVAVSSRS